jgi:excisionase family DNA binding protein
MMDTYVSTQDLADRLGVSVFTIRRYIRAGKLPAVKLDGVYRVSREDIIEFLKSREIGHVPSRASEPSPPARNEAALVPSPSSSSAATTTHQA